MARHNNNTEQGFVPRHLMVKSTTKLQIFGVAEDQDDDFGGDSRGGGGNDGGGHDGSGGSGRGSGGVGGRSGRGDGQAMRMNKSGIPNSGPSSSSANHDDDNSGMNSGPTQRRTGKEAPWDMRLFKYNSKDVNYFLRGQDPGVISSAT